MPDKIDYKKEYKDLYLPKSKPSMVEVPAMNFIMIDGKGDPNESEYQNAVSVLYALTFTIKMSKMGKNKPEGYFEYVVPPLEGLWWCEGGRFDFNERDNWRWTSMIRQPEFVDLNVFKWAADECKIKKPELDVSSAKFESYAEGLCVQMMHIGPYADEPSSMKILQGYMEENNLKDMVGLGGKHHEIYLSDPRRTDHGKLKTVLRHPVEKA